MSTTTKCPHCLGPLDVPSLLGGENAPAFVRCARCELPIVYDQTGLDPRGTMPAIRHARNVALPGYTLLGVLATGGMGFLYSAVRAETSHLCVLKILPPEFVNHPALRERFQREAHAMRALRHANVIPIIDASREGESPYIAMPFIPGRTLASVLHQRLRLDLEEVVAIASQLGDALDHIHKSGFVHRDVKPSNMLLTSKGDVMLIDFGIACALDTSSHLTEDGTALGTPAYNAPEVFEGHDSTSLSDQYSLAVVLYQMLTGKLPMGVFEKPADRHNRLPEDSRDALLRALHHDPPERHDTVKHFTRAFLRPLMHQTPLVTDQREAIRLLSNPTDEQLCLQPHHEGYSTTPPRENNLVWLLRRLSLR